jgi:hypothetical protein
MSDTNADYKAEAAANDIPRMEPWLAISLLAFIPGIGLFILPPAAHIALYVAMAVLMATGIGMFLRSEWRKSPPRD